jgi:hypothetical protein
MNNDLKAYTVKEVLHDHNIVKMIDDLGWGAAIKIDDLPEQHELIVGKKISLNEKQNRCVTTDLFLHVFVAAVFDYEDKVMFIAPDIGMIFILDTQGHDKYTAHTEMNIWLDAAAYGIENHFDKVALKPLKSIKFIPFTQSYLSWYMPCDKENNWLNY